MVGMQLIQYIIYQFQKYVSMNNIIFDHCTNAINQTLQNHGAQLLCEQYHTCLLVLYPAHAVLKMAATIQKCGNSVHILGAIVSQPHAMHHTFSVKTDICTQYIVVNIIQYTAVCT